MASKWNEIREKKKCFKKNKKFYKCPKLIAIICEKYTSLVKVKAILLSKKHVIAGKKFLKIFQYAARTFVVRQIQFISRIPTIFLTAF
jgi:hypothetical protein